jgi:hypothetical protein
VVRAGTRTRLLAGAMALASLGGCATTRIERGVFHSDKGYRVAVPAGAWSVASDSRADLELRHGGGQAGIVVNAACGRNRARGPLEALARHLLSGIRDRSVITAEDVPLNGRTARHAVVDGRLGDSGDPMRIELYVMRDDRCLYDFLYAAPPGTFEATRLDFQRLVGTFDTREK